MKSTDNLINEIMEKRKSGTTPEDLLKILENIRIEIKKNFKNEKAILYYSNLFEDLINIQLRGFNFKDVTLGEEPKDYGTHIIIGHFINCLFKMVLFGDTSWFREFVYKTLELSDKCDNELMEKINMEYVKQKEKESKVH